MSGGNAFFGRVSLLPNPATAVAIASSIISLDAISAAEDRGLSQYTISSSGTTTALAVVTSITAVGVKRGDQLRLTAGTVSASGITFGAAALGGATGSIVSPGRRNVLLPGTGDSILLTYNGTQWVVSEVQVLSQTTVGWARTYMALTQTVASAVVTNTTNETMFDSRLLLPASYLKAGTTIKCFALVTRVAINGADTTIWRIKLAANPAAAAPIVGATLGETTAAAVPANGYGILQGELVIRTAGAPGTSVQAGRGVTTAGTLARAEVGPTAFSAFTGVDTTVDNTLGVTATQSAANAGNSDRLDMFSVLVA